jgi:hypothetical protein
MQCAVSRARGDDVTFCALCYAVCVARDEGKVERRVYIYVGLGVRVIFVRKGPGSFFLSLLAIPRLREGLPDTAFVYCVTIEFGCLLPATTHTSYVSRETTTTI